MTFVDSEAGLNPLRLAVEEWSGVYDHPHHLFPGYEGQRHSCPRRIEGAHHHLIEGADLPDQWQLRHSMGQGEPVGLACTYCGSLHPGRFLQLLGEGWIVGPTDKSYKAYLDRPYTAEEWAARKTAWLGGDAVARAVTTLGERDGKTPDQIDADVEAAWAEYAAASAGGHTVAKVSFQHVVAERGVDAFCELHNSGGMRIGYPGRFYVAPYFTRPAQATP